MFQNHRLSRPRTASRTGLLLLTAAIVGCAPSAETRSLPAPESVGISSEGLARIRPAVQALVDSGRVAGVTALVARDGRVVYREAIGPFDAERPDPLTTDHLFRIYSMTKPVTAVAILMLQEQGKLNIEDPVSKYIPAFADAKVFAGGSSTSPQLRAPARPPTVRDLLTHTSGLTYGVFGNSPVDSIYTRAGMLDPGMTLQQFADSLARLPLLYSPGERWAYSVGLDVAGRVVEVASGLTFDEFLRRELFEPLGMRNTSFLIRAGDEDRLMPIHNVVSGRLVPQREIGASFERSARFFSGGGGLISTMDDYLRFAQMLLNRGTLDGVRILSPSSVELLSRNHLPEAIRATTLAGRNHGFGLAVAVQVDPPSGNTVTNQGTYWWAGLANTNFWIDPEERLIGMMFTQMLPSGSAGAAYGTFRRLVYEALE